MKKLIDTNVVIDHLTGYDRASEYLRSLEDSRVVFSSITEAELISGEPCRSSKRREQVQKLLQKWNKIPVDSPIALKAGDVRRKNSIGTPDSIIAATALRKDAALVTRNTADFRSIDELEVEKPYER